MSSRIGKGRPLRPDPSERGRRINKSRFGLLTVDEAEAALPFVLSLMQHEADWLTLGIPVAAFRLRYAVNDTWVVAQQPWLVSLSRALADVANHVHRSAPILVGVVGEETSGCWRRPQPESGETTFPEYPLSAAVAADVVERRGGFVVPPDLQQVAPKVVPVVLPSGLLYVPPWPDAALTGA